MRYGTIPLVRKTGGLYDTVLDMGEDNGYGITFTHASVGDVTHGIHRAIDLYENKIEFNAIRSKLMTLDFSWDQSAEQYESLYKNL
jgi:starch synthase